MNEKNDNEIKELIELADSEFIKFVKDGKYKKFLDSLSNLHNYSTSNILLILSQFPNATYVQGAGKWAYVGRTLNENAKKIKIITPIIEKKTIMIEPENIEDEPESKQVEFVSGYQPNFVYDVSQTDGESFRLFDSTEEMAKENFEIYKKALESCLKYYKFSYEKIANDIDGYCDTNNKCIVIKRGMPSEKTLTTLIHEIAHAFAHNKKRENFKGHIDKATKEIEAESVAYVVSKKLGLKTNDFNMSYITNWAKADITKFRKNVDLIRSVSSLIISKVEPQIMYELAKQDTKQVDKIKKQKKEEQALC